MLYKYNKNLVANAQELRKNMTPEEKQLWYQFFKKLPITVNRQKNIGDYIVDFFIAQKRLAIEIDGRQHLLPDHKTADKIRDDYLNSLGITVLRYDNRSINNNFSAVCNDILKHLGLTAMDLKNQK